MVKFLKRAIHALPSAYPPILIVEKNHQAADCFAQALKGRNAFIRVTDSRGHVLHS